ncbi:MAG: hypothetical protein ACKVW3_07475 [Phycisphaerales bacterium]
MKILLDNCMDVRVKRLFPGHDVSHAREHGWKDLVNGRLIGAASAAGFAVLVTVDKNIRFQQHLSTLPLSVFELDVLLNRFRDIAPLATHVPAALEHTRRFAFVSLKPDGTIECLAERVAGGG